MKTFLIQIFIIFGVTSMAKSEIATLGGGCFWCVEAVFQRVEGVISVKPGYAGGNVKNPTYKQICTGNTGHAEVAKIEFDPSKITYSQILNVFWQSHDPTTLNRQGNDVGTQYRSVIFFHNESQREIAKKSKIDAEESGYWDDEIVTDELSSIEQGFIFDKVSFGYVGARNVLRDVSFSIPIGKTIAIVGPSGSGKSTIGKLIFGFYKPLSGKILIDGRDSADLNTDTVRKQLAVTPQDLLLTAF